MLKRSRSGAAGASRSAFVAAPFAAAAIFLTAPAAAQPEVFPSDAFFWTVQPSFGSSTQGRDNVSGATCMTLPPSHNCLVVNDAALFAQLFSVAGTRIIPGQVVGYSNQPPPDNVS